MPIQPHDPAPSVEETRPHRIKVIELLGQAGDGGAQEHVHDLASGLPRERFGVLVASLGEGPALSRMAGAGVETAALPAGTDDEAVADLLALLRERRPHVLHAHMYRAEIVAARAIAELAAAGEPVPYLLATVHSSRIRPPADQAALAALNGRFRLLLAVSRSIADKLTAEGRAGVPIEVLYDGVDLARFSPRKPDPRHRMPGHPVGTIGRMEPEKGHDVLLAAWPAILARSPGSQLLFIGDGSLRPSLERMAARLPAPARGSVRFLGWRDDVADLLAGPEVVVLPSHREALGLALIEALAAARPVVASAVGGIPEVIEDGRSGLLVPAGDAVALADAVGRVLEDPALAARLGTAGRERAVALFGQERMLAGIAAIYEAGALPVTRASAARSSRRRAARS